MRDESRPYRFRLSSLEPQSLRSVVLRESSENNNAKLFYSFRLLLPSEMKCGLATTSTKVSGPISPQASAFPLKGGVVFWTHRQAAACRARRNEVTPLTCDHRALSPPKKGLDRVACNLSSLNSRGKATNEI